MTFAQYLQTAESWASKDSEIYVLLANRRAELDKK